MDILLLGGSTHYFKKYILWLVWISNKTKANNSDYDPYTFYWVSWLYSSIQKQTSKHSRTLTTNQPHHDVCNILSE